jgi:hypothetical protein
MLKKLRPGEAVTVSRKQGNLVEILREEQNEMDEEVKQTS